MAFFLIILGVLLTAGCEGNGGSEEETPAMPAEGGEGRNSIDDSGIIDVEIRDFKYVPENLTVKVGQTVRWTNYDTALHDVVGSGIESEYLKQGETFTFTFEKEGTYDYICTIHPWMKGRVNADPVNQ